MRQSSLSKDTTLCISLAQKPSNFGTTLFNAAFVATNQDFIYKAVALKDDGQSLRAAIAGMRALNIRGCGISMPFKIPALKLVDSLDPPAQKIGAINTIVNNRGRLKGYNTDYYGAHFVLKNIPIIRNPSVIMLGSGGVARAICAALVQLRLSQVTIIARDRRQANKLARTWGYKTAPWGQHLTSQANIFINATPIGMAPNSNKSPLTLDALNNFTAVMDVVINPLETKLIKQAKQKKLTTIPGHQMSLHQAAKQFELYTDHSAPLEVMTNAIQQIRN